MTARIVPHGIQSKTSAVGIQVLGTIGVWTIAAPIPMEYIRGNVHRCVFRSVAASSVAMMVAVVRVVPVQVDTVVNREPARTSVRAHPDHVVMGVIMNHLTLCVGATLTGSTGVPGAPTAEMMWE